MLRIHRSKFGTRRRSGAAVLELALTMTILNLIAWGMVEFGYFFFVKNMMESAAREGCRAGIVSGATNSSINQQVWNQLNAGGLFWGSSPSVPSTMSATMGGYTVKVYDLTTDSGMTNPLSNVTSVPAGDTLGITVTLTWSSIPASFRPAAMIGGTSGSLKTIVASSAMRKEG